MSRPLRIQFENAWYHVMNRGKRGEKIFQDKADFIIFIELLEELHEVFNINVASYCLMTNHYHLLLQTPDANLSRSMRHLNGVYTQKYNKSHNYDGPLFRGRYKSIVVDSDSYALELVRYIHRNPLEAGIVDDINKYRWCTHKAYLSSADKWKWLHKDYILKLFSNSKPESIRLYKKFVKQETPETITNIYKRKNLLVILGKKTFINRVKEKFFNESKFEEIPETKKISPDAEKIKQTVCKEYNIEGQDLYYSRRGYLNEPRNIAIYLVRRLRNDTLKQVGDEFRISKYSTVSSIVEKVKKDIRLDKSLKKRVGLLIDKITKGHRQT